MTLHYLDFDYSEDEDGNGCFDALADTPVDRHPAVLAAAVVAKPDARWGETPCAFVELKADAQVTAEQIVAHCKQHLAGFKVPRAVVFGELPKTSTGKIQKFELRKQAGSAAAIDI